MLYTCPHEILLTRVQATERLFGGCHNMSRLHEVEGMDMERARMRASVEGLYQE
jgi:hypothetical protein